MNLAYPMLVVFAQGAVVQSQDTIPGVIELLETGSEAQLQEAVRHRPNDARDALARLFRLSVAAPRPEGRVRRLVQAERVARAYALVWSDSFLIRRVEQFEGWSIAERRDKVEADSLRLAGVGAYYRQGPEPALRLWERSLSECRALGDVAGQAAALGNLGAGYYAMGELERALRYHTRALELAEAAGDYRTKGNALGNIASVHKDRGEMSLAAEFYGRALEVRPLSGDRRGEAADLNNLGLVRDALGDVDGAEAHFRRALELNQSDGQPRAAATNLSNLANVATERGNYDDALRLYSEALAIRRETGDRQGEAHDLTNLGLLHLRWGDYSASLRTLQDALALLAGTGQRVRRAEVWNDIAAVHAAMGHLQGALEAFDSAQGGLGDEGRSLEPDLALQRADLLTELGDYEVADKLYRQAGAGYQLRADATGQAEAEEGLGVLSVTRGEYDAAEEAFSRALLIQESLADPRPAALTQISLGDVRLRRGDTTGARESYRRALATQEALGDAVAEAAALGALADLDRELGALDSAAVGYRRALGRLRDRPAPPVEWLLHFGLGLTLRAQNRPQDAAAELQRAIGYVEAVGGALPLDERRYGYLGDKWDLYAELVRTELARGRTDTAFAVSEKMRARQLVDLLARGRTRSAAASDDLVREEQTLRRRIGQVARALYPSALPTTRPPAATRGNANPDELRGSLASAQASYQQLFARLSESRPEYASMVSGTTATIRDLQQLLPSDAVFIEYLLSDDWAVAFVVSEETVTAVELATNRRALRQLIEFCRKTVRRPGSVASNQELWRAPLRRLYQQLIAPLEAAGYLRDRRLLVVVPHGELHYLPFQALLKPGPAGERFLIESFDIAYVPSASAWVSLSQRNRASAAAGMLAMAPRPRSLAVSEQEVRLISRGDAGAEVVVGAHATEAEFVRLAPDRRVIHLATHGVLNPLNPLYSFIQLNPAGGTDGKLEVREIFALRLAADLVVLSACQTAVGSGVRGDVPPGDDWVGLVRAFLYAGAQSVVASLWPVDDQATAALMARFYASLRQGRSKAAALGDAQRAYLRGGQYAAPFYWAAFTLTGTAQ